MVTASILSSISAQPEKVQSINQWIHRYPNKHIIINHSSAIRTLLFNSGRGTISFDPL